MLTKSNIRKKHLFGLYVQNVSPSLREKSMQELRQLVTVYPKSTAEQSK